jgi:transcriptional regulator with XRE-family HTH domain
MHIGDKIKKLRELKNYTQQYMAQELDLSISGYGKIERNGTDISISRLQQIAVILGIDIQTILNFDDRTIFNGSQENEKIELNVQNNSNRNHVLERLIDKYKEENSYLKELVKELTQK